LNDGVIMNARETTNEEAGQALTFAVIAGQLNAAGYRTARGKTFGRGTVHRLMGGEPGRTMRDNQ